MAEQKLQIDGLLEQGQTIQVYPEGFSMYPMFVPGRDAAILSPVKGHRLHRGDVVLYRRPQGILVLHRICRVRPEGLYLVGDNQIALEGPLSPTQVKGVLTAFVHNGKTISVNHVGYVLCSRCWLFLRPVRRPIQLLAAKLKRRLPH